MGFVAIKNNLYFDGKIYIEHKFLSQGCMTEWRDTQRELLSLVNRIRIFVNF